MAESASPGVLITDDNEELVDLYSDILNDEYTIRTAYTGHEALTKLDSTIDVVLLDRRMPAQSGDEVLAEIRDQDIDCRVAMVTALKPELDIIKLGFDAYLTKPVQAEELRDTVKMLVNRVSLDEELQEYYALVSKQSILEQEYSSAELANNEEYEALREEIQSHRAAVRTALGDMSSDSAFLGAIREITQEQ